MTFPPVYLAQFAEDILVACPRCEGRAHLRRFEGADDRGYRFLCPGCGRVGDWLLRRDRVIPGPGGGPALGGFGLDLWLQTPCVGEILWAYNRPHLDFLASFVAASLRERSRSDWAWCRNGSLNSRLPRWMLAGKNREAVLKGIEALQARCDASG